MEKRCASEKELRLHAVDGIITAVGWSRLVLRVVAFWDEMLGYISMDRMGSV